MFSEDEIYRWELEQQEMELGRFCPEKHRPAFEPHKDRMFKARKRIALKWGGWDKETYHNSKMWKRHIRAKYRMIDEDSHHPPKHEYHTHGWLSW